MSVSEGMSERASYMGLRHISTKRSLFYKGIKRHLFHEDTSVKPSVL